MATAPAEWIRQDWQQLAPDRDLVVLCEENTFPSLPPHAVAIVLDSVRYPPGFLRDLPNAVVTLDAPAEGARLVGRRSGPSSFTLSHGPSAPASFVRFSLKTIHAPKVRRLKLVKIGVKIIEARRRKAQLSRLASTISARPRR